MSTRSMRGAYERERKDPYKIIDNLLELYDRMDKLLDKELEGWDQELREAGYDVPEKKP